MTFEDFWTIYDKKAGRKRCQARWRYLTKNDLLKIESTLPAYITSTPDKAFRKHPLTYLAGHCWHDEIITFKPKWEKPQPHIKIIKPSKPDQAGTDQIKRAYAKQMAAAQFARQNSLDEPQESKIKSLISQGLNAYQVAHRIGCSVARVRAIKSSLR